MSPQIFALYMQPDAIEYSSLSAWWMDNSDKDQRLPHKYVLDFLR